MLHCQAAKAEALKGIANKKERERDERKSQIKREALVNKKEELEMSV